MPLSWKWAFRNTRQFFWALACFITPGSRFCGDHKFKLYVSALKAGTFIDWYGLNENSKVFNEQLLIKCADNVQRKVTKYQPEYIHFIVGMVLIYNKQKILMLSHYPAFLLCRLALYGVQNKDDRE